MKNPIKALFFEPEYEAYIKRTEQLFDFFELQAICVDKEDDFIKAIDEFRPDIIISTTESVNLPSRKMLEITKKRDAFLPIIFIADAHNEASVLDLLHDGADDYLIKSNLKRLPYAVNNAVQRNNLRRSKETADKRLSESEVIYKQLVSEITQGLAVHEIILDNNGKAVDYRFIDMNSSFEKLTGLKKADCIGKTVRELLPDTEQYWIDKYGLVALTGVPIHFEQYSQSLDKYFEVVAYSPIKGKFATVFSDITERVINSQKLRDNESLYRMMADNSTDVLFTTDLNLQITYISPSILQLNGYTVEESMQQVFWDITTRESAVYLKKTFHEQMEIEMKGDADPNRTLKIEFEEYHKNGQLLTIESAMRFLRDEKGIPFGIIGVSRNITERKKNEIKVQKRNRILRGINALSIQLTNDPSTNFFEVICDELAGIFEAKAVIYNDFDSKKLTFHPKYYSGKLANMQLIQKAIGKLMLRKQIKINQSDLDQIISEQKLGASNSLQETSFNNFSYLEVKTIEQFTGKNYYVGIPIINNQQLLGSFIMVFDIDHDFAFEDELSAFSTMVSSILDARKKSEELRQSELNYRTLINNSHDLIIVTRNNQILFANNRTLAFSGLSLEEIQQTDYVSLIHPDDRMAIVEAYDELRKTGMFKSRQLRVVFQNNAKWLSISAIPIEYEGQPANLTFGTDITEQKLKDDELAEELEMRSLLYQVSNDGIVILDHNHKIFSVNDRFAEMLGYDKSELMQLYTWDFDDLADEEYVRKSFSDISNINTIFESKHLRKNGTTYDVEVSARGFNYKQKEYVVCICRDITDQKNAARKLQEDAESLENAQNIANMGSWEYNNESNQMSWSKSMFKLLELDGNLDKASNDLFMSMVHPDDLSNLLAIIDKISEQATPAHTEFRMVLPNGKYKWLSNNILPVIKNKKVVGFKGTNIDITSLKQIQNELAESQQQLNKVFEHVPAGLLSFNEYGIITACNSYFSKIIGASIEQLVGLDILQLPNKEVVSTFKKALNGNNCTWEGNYESYLSGKKSVVRLTAAPLKNETGLISGGVAIVEEISERLAAEKQIRESQAQFSSSFYFSSVAMVISKFADGSFIEVNDAWCRLSGYTHEYVRGKKITDLDVIDDSQINYVYKYLKTRGNLNEASIQIKNRGGEFLTVIASLVTYEMNGEELILASMIDISERIRNEQELLKLTRAIEQLPVSVVITNLDGTIEYVNPKAIQSTGYTAKELIGQNPRVLKGGETSKEEYLAMYEQLRQGYVWKGEFHNKKKDGSLYWESATIAPTLNDMGEITHYIAIKEDISLHKMMASALKESETRYKEIFINNPIPMWIYDVESLHFVEVNNKAIEDYGFTAEEFHGMTLKDIRPEEDVPLLLEDIKTRTEAVQIASQFRHRYKDGTIINVELTSYAIPSIEGKKMRMVIANNITERVNARKALEDARAVAEASDKLKTNFLNNISHEVRTPLNGIMGATSLLNDPDLERSEIPELMEIVNLSTTRLIQTITDFMDISLITSGNIELNPKPVKLADILEKFRHQYNQECVNKGLSFKISYTEETGNIYIELDPELISKAINHLLSNAVKFTSKGSIECGIEKASDQIIIYINDTGIGIAKENIPTVFEHFRQEDDSSSRRFEGSGLGLSIVKGLVDLLGGTISVESEKGTGSTFRIHFSLKNRNDSDNHTSEEAISVIAKEPVVLIAEDEDSNFVVLAMVMRKSFNAKVLHALNGLEAIKMVQSNPDIDVVLMDLKMPVMDGFEATAQLKKLQPDLPVIAITAFAMSGDEHRAMEIGCDYYIAKPVSRRELHKAMRKFGFLGNDPH